MSYYFFRKGLHGVICFKRENADVAATAELVVGNLAGITLGRHKWHVICKKSDWMPKDAEVQTSIHEWHIGTVVARCNEFGEEFGSYDALFKNCNTWKKNVVKYLETEGPASGVRKPQSFQDFVALARNCNVALQIEIPAITAVQAQSEETPLPVMPVAPQWRDTAVPDEQSVPDDEPDDEETVPDDDQAVPDEQSVPDDEPDDEETVPDDDQAVPDDEEAVPGDEQAVPDEVQYHQELVQNIAQLPIAMLEQICQAMKANSTS